MKKSLIIITFLLFLVCFGVAHSDPKPEISGDEIIYRLTIDTREMEVAGRKATGLAINDSIPAPTLRFTEGKTAVIHVTNRLAEETSIHWHGLILPNFQDGVPYLTTPPIRPGQTFTYRFPLVQSGTYWYHSHTGLQEQRGLYGGIIIEPAEPRFEYDRDLVLVLSDWTSQHPQRVLKNLKRHNEWYGIRIGSAPSLLAALTSGTLPAQLKLWADRMPGMHISDIYYDAFLANGKEEQEYRPEKPGERIRLRVINAAASTYFWLTRGGGNLRIVSADGVNVQPVETDKVLIGVAETYDFLIAGEEGKRIEFRATAQDVTGKASLYIGEGSPISAPSIPPPDYPALNARMAKMHGGDGHQMDLPGDETGDLQKPAAMDHRKMQKEHDIHPAEMPGMNQTKDMKEMKGMDITDPMIMWDPGYRNRILKSPMPTHFPDHRPRRRLVLNLTGNMWRYIWRINKIPLSRADKIKIHKGEVVQLVLNNTTMMHHPMHLHGHFFRVLNGNGRYSPLKHTVDVPPMSRVTIEFDAREDKDWFFHCHILYHMSAGMARIFSYAGSRRDPRMEPFDLKNLLRHDRRWFFWGDLTGASHMGTLNLMASNTRNRFQLKSEYGWQEGGHESRLDYEWFAGDYFRLYGGLKVEGEKTGAEEETHAAAQVGLRYLLLYILDVDLSLDHRLNPELGLETHLPLTRRFMLAGHLEWKLETGLIEDLPAEERWGSELVWNLNLEWIAARNLLLTAGYDNRFHWGAGIRVLF